MKRLVILMGLYFLKAQTYIYQAVAPYLKLLLLAICVISSLYFGYCTYGWALELPHTNWIYSFILERKGVLGLLFVSLFAGITLLWLLMLVYLTLFSTTNLLQKKASKKYHNSKPKAYG